MLELIAFVLFQIATFGNSSPLDSAQAPAARGYQVSAGSIPPDTEAATDTIKVRVSGTGGWGHD